MVSSGKCEEWAQVPSHRSAAGRGGEGRGGERRGVEGCVHACMYPGSIETRAKIGCSELVCLDSQLQPQWGTVSPC